MQQNRINQGKRNMKTICISLASEGWEGYMNTDSNNNNNNSNK